MLTTSFFPCPVECQMLTTSYIFSVKVWEKLLKSPTRPSNLTTPSPPHNLLPTTTNTTKRRLRFKSSLPLSTLSSLLSPDFTVTETTEKQVFLIDNVPEGDILRVMCLLQGTLKHSETLRKSLKHSEHYNSAAKLLHQQYNELRGWEFISG